MDPGVVSLERATVRYGDLVVLREITLAIDAGQVLGVRGANGAGKTTLLRLLAGVVHPSTGTRAGPPACAYVPAAITPPLLSAGRWLREVRRRRPADAFAVLEQLGFEGDLTKSCRTLSFGNLRKVLLADALASSASLVLIDEAASGLDARASRGLAELVGARRAGGAAVVLAVQDGQPLDGADSIVHVAHGAIRITDTAPAAADVEIAFRGPGARTRELTQAAEALGFRPAGSE